MYDAARSEKAWTALTMVSYVPVNFFCMFSLVTGQFRA